MIISWIENNALDYFLFYQILYLRVGLYYVRFFSGNNKNINYFKDSESVEN